MLKGYKTKAFTILQILTGVLLAIGWVDMETFTLLSGIWLPGIGYGLVDKIDR